ANVFSRVGNTSIAVDARRGFGYLVGSGGPGGDTGIRRFSLSTMTEDLQALSSGIFIEGSMNAPRDLTCGPDGTIYCLRSGALYVDQITIRAVLSVGVSAVII